MKFYPKTCLSGILLVLQYAESSNPENPTICTDFRLDVMALRLLAAGRFCDCDKFAIF
jgi:hypothetical protein